MDSGTFVLASPGVAAAGDRTRAFSAARRHSRRVVAMRRAMEIVVAAGVAALVAWTFYRNFGHTLSQVSFDGVGIEGGRITMDRPRLSGARPGGGSYDITAVKAMQDAQHPGDVDLALIGGDIVSSDKEVSRLNASSGHYAGADETLDLVGDVRLLNPRYQFFLRSVHIAFKRGDYSSNEPVEAHILPDMAITADSFVARDSGAEATFTGHVRTLIHGKEAAPDRAAP
jgi:lipopolysaccharide export system protein LptC